MDDMTGPYIVHDEIRFTVDASRMTSTLNWEPAS